LPAAVLKNAHQLLRNWALGVDESGTIVEIIPVDELGAAVAQLKEYPDEIWSAAPIMMHAHLESYDAPSESWQRSSFAEWVTALLSWRSQERLNFHQSARASLKELAENGCALVLAQSSESEEAIATDGNLPALINWCEIFAPDESEASTLFELNKTKAHDGISLHAPFSVSVKLATKLFSAGGPVSLHLGEHTDEREALKGRGQLAEMIAKLSGQSPAQDWDSPISWLKEVGGLRRGVLAVHCGDLDRGELQTLEMNGVAIAWCPGTHEYFSRSTPNFFHAGLLPPFIGCDSRASNNCLDPIREFELANTILPDYSPEEWWDALTVRPAEWLARPEFGQLSVGKKMCALRFEDTSPTSASQFLSQVARNGRQLRRGVLALA